MEKRMGGIPAIRLTLMDPLALALQTFSLYPRLGFFFTTGATDYSSLRVAFSTRNFRPSPNETEIMAA